jgi:hypothetical protein
VGKEKDGRQGDEDKESGWDRIVNGAFIVHPIKVIFEQRLSAIQVTSNAKL